MDLKERISGIFTEIQFGINQAQVALNEAKEEMTELESVILKLAKHEAVADYNRQQREQKVINKEQEVTGVKGHDSWCRCTRCTYGSGPTPAEERSNKP